MRSTRFCLYMTFATRLMEVDAKISGLMHKTMMPRWGKILLMRGRLRVQQKATRFFRRCRFAVRRRATQLMVAATAHAHPHACHQPRPPG